MNCGGLGVWPENIPIEIQVRTALQHLWGKLSEKLADIYDPTIKYGGGHPARRELLDESSEAISSFEIFEQEMSGDSNPGPIKDYIDGKLFSMRQKIQSILKETIILIAKERNSNI